MMRSAWKRMRKQTHSPDRRAGILVCTLVCLGIVMSVLLSATMASLRHRRQLNSVAQLEQTRLLLDAVCDGVLQGDLSAPFTNEWELEDSMPLRVRVEIQDRENNLRVTIMTQTTTAVPRRVRRSRVLLPPDTK